MDNLIIDNSIFKISNYNINEFYGIYIDADFRLSTGNMCYLPSKNQIFFSINDYKDASDIASHLDELEKYKDNFCYIKMDMETLQTTCYCESEGVPYDLFEGPNDEIWCVVGYSKTSLNKEVCLPIGDRKDIKDCKLILDELSGDGCRIGGYPIFVQYDPRENEELRTFDTLLLQLDCEDECDLMFGDGGIANFFINEEDLKKLDFTKVLYNWDCC